MIQLNELRVGNILINPLMDGKVFVIRSGADIDEVYKMQELKAYPLSDNLLQKSGFKRGRVKLSGNNHLELDKDADHYNTFLRQIREDNHEEVILLSFEIVYLHQLQNLYFALTGKDLPFKL